MSQQTIHIIGGAGGIGRWFAEKCFLSASRKFCYDTNPKALETLPPAVAGCLVSQEKPYSAYSSQFQRSDWILLATPMTVFEETVTTLAAVAKEGSLFVAMTSVQNPAITVLHQAVPSTCTFLGCHPLFGHTVSSPIGQIIALTGYSENLSQHREFRNELANAGLLPTYLEASAHDEHMAVVQALTHFCLIGFSAAIADRGLHPGELLKLKTPNFQFLFAFASRILKLSTTTTGSIQSTTEASKVRQIFLSVLERLHKQLEAASNVTECAKVIEGVRDPLSGAEVDEGVEVAAVAVASLQRFEELLYKYKTSSAPFVFRHRITNNLHVCRIIKVDADEVTFEESTKVVEKDGKRLFAVGLGTEARANYRRFGINLPGAIKESIRKRNIKLLTADELREFHKELVLGIALVQNLRNPSGHKENYFEEWLPLLVKGLWRCEFLDCYRKRNESERVTVRLIFNPNCPQVEIVSRVRNLVEEGLLATETTGLPANSQFH